MAQDATKGFVFFYDYRKHLSILSDEERGRLLIALLDYGETGKEPELDGAALMAFSFISSQIDRDAEKYAEICRRRREAGKKGGSSKRSEQEAKKAEAVEGEGEETKEASENQDQANEANACFDKQTQANEANACFDKQTQANEANTNTRTNTKNKKKTNTKTNTKNKTNTSSSIEEEIAPKGAEVEEAVTPYKDIVNLYHDICQSYPKLKSVSSNRKKAMAARWKEYEGNLDAFRELFTKAEASSFMKGESERGWTADFNWMMNSDNMAKVLEGKYDDKEPKGSFDTDSFFEAAVARSFEQKAENPPATAGTCPRIEEKAKRLRAMLC